MTATKERLRGSRAAVWQPSYLAVFDFHKLFHEGLFPNQL
jgi:hypothetical protein